MTFEHAEDQGYLYLKGLLSIIYTDDYQESLQFFKNHLDINDSYLLTMLSEFMNIYNGAIDEAMKENIYSLIATLREQLPNYGEEEKRNRNNKINVIISKVNLATDDYMNSFISEQLRLRYISIFESLKRFLGAKQEELKDYIKLSMVDDFNILISFSSLVSDADFKLILDEYLNDDYECMFNINALVTEWPSLLKDETFKNRVSILTNELEKNISSLKDDSYSKQETQFAQKMFKKYQTNLHRIERK